MSHYFLATAYNHSLFNVLPYFRDPETLHQYIVCLYLSALLRRGAPAVTHSVPRETFSETPARRSGNDGSKIYTNPLYLPDSADG